MTNTKARTDVHRPSSPDFDPANYECLGVFDLHPEYGDNGARMNIVNRALAAGSSFLNAPHGPGQCSHCGARIRYAALMNYNPDGTLMYVGETCLDNRFSVDLSAFQMLRKRAAYLAKETRSLDRRNQLRKAAAEWLADADPIIREEFSNDDPAGIVSSSYFLSDLLSRLNQFGSLTFRQESAALKAIRREREEREIKAAAEPAPEGSGIEVVGIVEHTWFKDGMYPAFKMRVRHQAGWAAISTIPASILKTLDHHEELRGATVVFVASLSYSRDYVTDEVKDNTVVFASRPKNARIL